MIKSNYRSDIDGLRAMAVLSVILYHLDIQLFSGGFIGVDVFFVISGYLITKNISVKVESKTFTFKDFYSGRIRRLFPAFLVTLAVSFILASLIYSPDTFKRLSTSTLFAISSLSNFFFWNEAGYFNTDSALKPLLHTWSLSVEEQFYIFWPLVLIVIQLKKQFAIPIILIIIITGLFISEIFIPIDQVAAFFLTPFRIFEFSIGALLHFYTKRSTNNIINETLTITGLLFILIPVVQYTSETKFPGINALYPCIGTALLLFTGNTKTHISKIYSNKIMIQIGILSYSLYLTHWPIIVFYKHINNRPFLTPTDMIIILTACFISSLALHYFVESKFRYPPIKHSTHKYPSLFLLGNVLMITAIVSLSYHSLTHNGWDWRFKSDTKQLLEISSKAQEDRFKLIRSRCSDVNYPIKCVSFSDSLPNAVIIGNSHALDVYNALDTAYSNVNFIQLGLGGCHSFYDRNDIHDSSYMPKERCVQHNENVLKILKTNENKIDAIFISNYSGKKGADSIGRTVKIIKDSVKTQIILYGDAVVFYPKPLTELIVELSQKNDDIDHYLISAEKNYDILFSNIAKKYNIKYLSKLDAFCPKLKCKLIFNNTLLTYDHHHLTVPASHELGKYTKSHYPSFKEISESSIY